MEQKKQYYPSFLLAFKGKPFDEAALHAAWHAARIGGKVRGESEVAEYFREFQIDDLHWQYHQRILHDDVLYRLVSEGYLHPTIHPVAAIYYDTSFYPFVFPFIHTAILKKMSDAVRTGNTEAVKLLVQWIEPFGDYFHRAFYKMIEFTAEEILIELNAVRFNRKNLPYDTYARLSPAMMHLVNRLPQEYQPFRDRFAGEILNFATWLRAEMKVYTQPVGMLTRLKLLNSSADIHAQTSIQLKMWEQEKEQAAKEKFNLNHLIWIIPLFFALAYLIFRNTEFGRTAEDIQADRDIALIAEQKEKDEKWEKIDLRMENIDLNQLIAEELFASSLLPGPGGKPILPDKDPNRLDNGEEPYHNWLQPGRQMYPVQEITMEVTNLSECDVVVFLRQEKAPFMERAYYIRSYRSISIFDNYSRKYTMRIYAGSGWVDSLVAPAYDQKLLKAGVPEETKDQFPATTELRGRFLYPAKSIEQNLQPALTDTLGDAQWVTPDGAKMIYIRGDWDGIEIRESN